MDGLSPAQPAGQARPCQREVPSHRSVLGPPPPPCQQPLKLGCDGGLFFCLRHAPGAGDGRGVRTHAHPHTTGARRRRYPPGLTGAVKTVTPPDPPTQPPSPPSWPTAWDRMLRDSSLAHLLVSIGNVLDVEAAGADAGATALPSAAGHTVPQAAFDAGVPVEAVETIISAVFDALSINLDSCPPPPPPAPAPSSPAPHPWTGGGGFKTPYVIETGGAGAKTPTNESACTPSGHGGATTPSAKAPSAKGDKSDAKKPVVKAPSATMPLTSGSGAAANVAARPADPT